MKLFLSETEISLITQQLAAEIRTDYQHKRPLFLGLLDGALYFTADLCRNLPVLQYDLAFSTVKSYNTTESTGIPSIVNFPVVRGSNIVILDEIVDTGITIDYVMKQVMSNGAKSIQVCTLINNLYRRKENLNLEIKYSGITITENHFFVGYGLDVDGWGRTFKDIYRKEKI